MEIPDITLREELIAHNNYLCGIGFGILFCVTVGGVLYLAVRANAQAQEEKNRTFIDYIAHGPAVFDRRREKEPIICGAPKGEEETNA